MIQRSGIGTANIPLSGNVGTGTHDIQARFNQGQWVTIVSGASGTYSGTLSNQVQGQGYLQVRWADTPNSTVYVPSVGIGEVFIIAGQSNASGRGSNNQTSGTFPSPFVSMFGNNYTWKICQDPTDSNASQVDTVSSDAAAAGSIWPILGGQVAQKLGVPVAFIPCALGNTSVTTWQPSGGATNRASIYGSMVWRGAHAVSGGARSVLWWQGENDALAGMTQATYYTNFTNFTANVSADAGCKVMPCKLQHADEYSDPAQAAINAAIGQAWASDVNTLTGPDLSGIDTEPESNVHLMTTAKLGSAATLWFNALVSAFGW